VKKILITSLFLVLGFATWACNRHTPLVPAGMTIPTPTPTTTSIPILTATLTATSTTACVYYTSTAVPFGTPVVFVPSTPIPTPAPFMPVSPYEFVIYNLADWQAIYGTAPPPSNVNFATQMIVGARVSKQCGIGPDLSSVCESSTQVSVLISNPSPLTSYTCYVITEVDESIIVPQSNLPVVWYNQ